MPHAGDACDNPFESVMCWGDARIIDDLEERAAILNEFQVRYGTDDNPRDTITAERVKGCGAIEITVTKMTGRRFTMQGKERWSRTAD